MQKKYLELDRIFNLLKKFDQTCDFFVIGFTFIKNLFMFQKIKGNFIFSGIEIIF
jgi:hypothetical protein